MRISQISQQNFNGQIHVLGELGHIQTEVLNTVMPIMKVLIKDHKFDLFIKKNSLGQTMVGTDVNSGYILNSENNFLQSARLAINDKLTESFITKKAKMIKKAIEELFLKGEDIK